MEFFYANKYRKDRAFLRDSVVLQELYGNDGFGVPILPVSAIPSRPGSALALEASAAAGVAAPAVAAAPSTAPAPIAAATESPVPVPSAEEVKAPSDAGSDGESGSEVSGGDFGGIPMPTAPTGGSATAAASMGRGKAGKDKNRPQRKPRTVDQTWCTTCAVARPTVLACMWAQCGNTVCRTCYSQQAASYRARAIGETWRGGVLNPFWLCLSCCPTGPAAKPGIFTEGAAAIVTAPRPRMPSAKVVASPVLQSMGPKIPRAPSGENKKRKFSEDYNGGGGAPQMQRPRQDVYPVPPPAMCVPLVLACCLMLLWSLEGDRMYFRVLRRAYQVEAMPYVRDSQSLLERCVLCLLCACSHGCVGACSWMTGCCCRVAFTALRGRT